LPDGAILLKVVGMTTAQQWREVLGCARCRWYRRAALVFTVAAACSLILW
jgi:hypothetical protein